MLFISDPMAMLLRFVDAREANKIISEVHKRARGPHMNGQILACNSEWPIISPTIESDCIKNIRKCHLCYIYAYKKLVAIPLQKISRYSNGTDLFLALSIILPGWLRWCLTLTKKYGFL